MGNMPEEEKIRVRWGFMMSDKLYVQFMVWMRATISKFSYTGSALMQLEIYSGSIDRPKNLSL